MKRLFQHIVLNLFQWKFLCKSFILVISAIIYYTGIWLKNVKNIKTKVLFLHK